MKSAFTTGSKRIKLGHEPISERAFQSNVIIISFLNKKVNRLFLFLCSLHDFWLEILTEQCAENDDIYEMKFFAKKTMQERFALTWPFFCCSS